MIENLQHVNDFYVNDLYVWLKLSRSAFQSLRTFFAFLCVSVFPQQTTAMSIQATDFQRVLNVVGEWYRRSFRDLLVNGQYAIHDIDRQQILYISMCQLKPLQPLHLQSRGLDSGHGPHSCFWTLVVRDIVQWHRWFFRKFCAGCAATNEID